MGRHIQLAKGEKGEPLKTTTADEKMEHLAAPSNGVGKGGRDVRKSWGTKTFNTIARKPPKSGSGMAQYTPTQTKLPENSYPHSEMVIINPPVLLKWVVQIL